MGSSAVGLACCLPARSRLGPLENPPFPEKRSSTIRIAKQTIPSERRLEKPAIVKGIFFAGEYMYLGEKQTLLRSRHVK